MPDVFQNKTEFASIVGLSLEYDKELYLPEGSSPFQITFNHHQFMDDLNRSCAFWNFDSASWLSDGCEVNLTGSSPTKTQCDCNHLTNFGLMLDWTGNSDPYHPF